MWPWVIFWVICIALMIAGGVLKKKNFTKEVRNKDPVTGEITYKTEEGIGNILLGVGGGVLFILLIASFFESSDVYRYLLTGQKSRRIGYYL